MERIIGEKAAALTVDQFVQEMVLGKIGSDIYNESKQVAPLRHVGIRKSKLLAQPAQAPKTETAATEQAPAAEEEQEEEPQAQA
jgi:small subunit ribosomal protein S3Ae